MSNKHSLCVMQVLPELVTGGVERGTLDVAKALIENGHRAIVVSNGGPMVESLKALGAEHITLPVHSKNPFVMRHNANRLVALMQALGVDIIHARSRAPAWSCLWAVKKTGTPFVTTFHGTYGHKGRLKRWYNNVMCRSDQTIAVSGFIADHIQDVYDKPLEDIKVIHRGIDMALFDQNNVDQESLISLKERWRINDHKPVIILPGRLTRWKGQLEFIEAIAQLRRKDFHALIVGSDQGREDYTQELKQAIREKGLEDIIRLCGHHDSMTEAYALADIVVSASNEPEAFGRVACEAQAMGCLVVATRHGGAMETICSAQLEWQCLPNNPASLSDALALVLAIPPEKKAEIAGLSRAHIQQNFSLESMCRQTLEVYKRFYDDSPE